MARDKLITIRIEGEKRDLFNQLAKSQNTDTASLLYDFISGCLDGTLDVGIVTGKKQRIDKIDNQIDMERIDKLETTTQQLDERLDKLSQKLEDWIWVSQRSQENHLTELKDQISILAIQLNSQKDSQEDRQQDRQEIDMEHLLKREKECSIATSPIPTIEETSPRGLPGLIDGAGEAVATRSLREIEPVPTVETVTEKDEAVYEPDSTIETGPGAIDPVTDSKPWYTIDDLLDCHYPGWPETKEGLRKKALRENWPKRTQRGSKGQPYEYQVVLPE